MARDCFADGHAVHSFVRHGDSGTSLDLVCMWCGKPFYACSKGERDRADTYKRRQPPVYKEMER